MNEAIKETQSILNDISQSKAEGWISEVKRIREDLDELKPIINDLIVRYMPGYISIEDADVLAMVIVNMFISPKQFLNPSEGLTEKEYSVNMKGDYNDKINDRHNPSTWDRKTEIKNYGQILYGKFLEADMNKGYVPPVILNPPNECRHLVPYVVKIEPLKT